MNLKRPPRNLQHRPERDHDAMRLALLDTVMDSYVRWRDESRTVQESYQSRARGRRSG